MTGGSAIGVITRKHLRPGGKVLDVHITPDKKKQVYLTVYKTNKEVMKKLIETPLLEEIEVDYEVIANENEGKGNTLVVTKLK